MQGIRSGSLRWWIPSSCYQIFLLFWRIRFHCTIFFKRFCSDGFSLIGSWGVSTSVLFTCTLRGRNRWHGMTNGRLTYWRWIWRDSRYSILPRDQRGRRVQMWMFLSWRFLVTASTLTDMHVVVSFHTFNLFFISVSFSLHQRIFFFSFEGPTIFRRWGMGYPKCVIQELSFHDWGTRLWAMELAPLCVIWVLWFHGLGWRGNESNEPRILTVIVSLLSNRWCWSSFLAP